MRNLIISSINYNLDHAVALLDTIDSVSYCDSSIGPYHSSIGSHVRHILDFFNCIVDGLDTNNIDLTARKRDEILSTNKEAAKNHIYMIQETLLSYVDINTNYLIHVTDDMGQGKVTVNYTLEGVLAHANSHATHHYAIIGYILDRLGIEPKTPSFGYNPTTPVMYKNGGVIL